MFLRAASLLAGIGGSQLASDALVDRRPSVTLAFLSFEKRVSGWGSQIFFGLEKVVLLFGVVLFWWFLSSWGGWFLGGFCSLGGGFLVVLGGFWMVFKWLNQVPYATLHF